MQLRFVDEPLKPRFDLEMVGADTIVAKVHVRAPERRPPLPAHQRRLVRGRAGLAHRHQRGHRAPARPARLARRAAAPAAQPDDRRARVRADQHDHLRPAQGRARGRRGAARSVAGRRRGRSRADVPHARRRLADRSRGLADAPRTATSKSRCAPTASRRRSSSCRPRKGRSARAASAATSPPSRRPCRSCSTSGSKPTRAASTSSLDGDDAIQLLVRRRRLAARGLGPLRARGARRHAGARQAGRDARARLERRRLAQRQDHATRARAWASIATSSSAACARARSSCACPTTRSRRSTPNACRRMIDREVELIAAAGKTGKIPLSQAGRVQELLQQAASSQRRGRPPSSSSRSSRRSTRSRRSRSRKGLKATLRPYQEQGLSWLALHPRDRLGRRPRRRHGSRQDDPDDRAPAARSRARRRTKPLRALIVAPTSVVTNWVREIERFAPDADDRALARRRPQGADGRARERRTSSSRATRCLRRDIDLLKKLRARLRDPGRGAEHQEPAERDRAGRQGARRRAAAWR